MHVPLLSRLQSRLRREAALGVEHTYLYELRSPHAVAPVDLDVEELAPERLHHLGEIGPFSGEEAMARVRRGDRCYAVWRDGELAHYSWVQLTGTHAIDAAALTVPVTPGELWIYNCRTAERYRGRGYYPSTLRTIVDRSFAEGFTRACIYAADTNVASLRGISRAGFKRIATLRALHIGRAYWRLLD
jgi:RimJ/RimL family protein N-acetyltransferase